MCNVHRPGSDPDVLLFSTPRGGSTWLFELIGTQPGFKSCDEPLNLRNSDVSRTLGIAEWRALYDPSAEDQICRYFRGIHHGRLTHMNRNPWEPNYRPLTRRIVYKVLHGAEYMASSLAQALDSRVVVLLRHPIPVALSRKVLPRLEAILQSKALGRYSAERGREMTRLASTGTPLQRSVLSWCLQTAPLLQALRPEWTVVTYEQLVVDAPPAVQHLAQALALPNPTAMLRRVNRASASIRGMSTPATRKVLAEAASPERTSWLVERWRQEVSSQEERGAMRVLDLFDIQPYEFGSVFPNESLWIDRASRSETRGDGQSD